MATTTMSAAHQEFLKIVGEVAAAIGDRPLDASLQVWLNETLPANGKTFTRLAALLDEGAQEGWLCEREAGGVRFGRPVKPGAEAGRFSVDVVAMPTVVGPHHAHPTGEIGMIVPTAGDAKFDGMGKGWYVYGPGSAHNPTVTEGSAYVLYLLPDGAIQFTGKGA